MGKALGIDSYLPHELSLSLGGCEVFIAALLLKQGIDQGQDLY